jgi:hypothetical protein
MVASGALPGALLTLALLAAGPDPAALPFLAGERMELSVEFLGIRVGEMRVSTGHREGALLPLLFQLRTGGIASIVDVRTQMSAQLDLQTLLPRGTQLESVEPGYRHADDTRFDRRAGKATWVSRGKYVTTHEVDMPPDTVDFVSLVFLLRRLPLPDGARHAFSVISESKIHAIVAEVVGRETLETDAGTFPAVQVRVPTGLTGKFSEKEPTVLWFSDDPRRILLRIRTKFSVGSVQGTLRAYQPGASE